jgi:glycosyltransferase involved in cell wall biosynthesis
MRIVHIADTQAIGGAERHVATLAEETANSGHDVVLLAPQPSFVAWLSREAPSTMVMQALDDAYQDASSQAQRGKALLSRLPDMVRLLRELEPDVVHANNGGFPGSDLCRIAMPAARIAGIQRRVMTVNSNPWPRDRLADRRVQIVADHLVWSCTHAVISPSQAVADGLLRRRGMPSRLGRLIHYGIPPAGHDPQLVARLREELAPDGELLVGMVSARAVAAKGYDVFVDALAEVEGPVRGALVGPLPEKLAERIEAEGLEERISLLGARGNVGDYYAAFDVLVVPSTGEECMPLVIMEAASVGTPTFGSRLSGIPEAVTDGVDGRLFEPGAAGELAKLIDSAASDRGSIASMGLAAKAGWDRRFRVETMVQRTLATYARAA